jgi:formylglycine-generating enzyme required for sulfatase activity
LRGRQTAISLRTFEFETVTTDTPAGGHKTIKLRAQYYIEDLGEGVSLEMVQIPEGAFLMGTSDSEAETAKLDCGVYFPEDAKIRLDDILREETPQHEVKVKPFFLSKFEVTQAQWRQISRLPKVHIDLAADPSLFKGSDRPVEEVSWPEAVEFCARLTRLTGRAYHLPSEAQWEYACRAGTATPFYFGNTITLEWVNHGADIPYGFVEKGSPINKTIPVGSLGKANSFGLYDMHGNVDEWCADTWHENYVGAPANASTWIEGGDDNYRVVRGCGWLQAGCYCRSAYRRQYALNNKSYFTGFRVAARPEIQ